MRHLSVLIVIAAFATAPATSHLSAQSVIVSQGADPSQSSQGATLSDTRVTLSMRDVRVPDALRTVAKQAGLRVTFGDRVLAVSNRVTIDAQDAPVEGVIRDILKGTGINMSVTSTGQLFFALVDKQVKNAQGIVEGKVIDAKSGKGISGANVSLATNARGVTTDERGLYRILGITAGSHTIVVRLVGYAKQARQVTVGDGVTVSVDFKIEPSASVLDQVVVTGTVVQSELRSVPNTITVITAKQIEERGITRIDQLFRGEVPGLFVLNQGSSSFAVLDEVAMFSRGATAISFASLGVDQSTGTSNPIKTYLDGVELADPKYLSQIDPKSIERVEILSGPQASTIYGSNAINGVMQIFTKRGTTSRPQFSVSLLSGWVENNFSSARTPQHDYSMQVNGVEERLSYSTGGSWSYLGPWTPAKQTSRINTFGSSRLELYTTMGQVTADIALRHGLTQNQQRGASEQLSTAYRETGLFRVVSDAGLNLPRTYILVGQTFAFTLGHNPSPWWSQEFGIGQDVQDTEGRDLARGYRFISDTTLFLYKIHSDRRSVRYTTTARIPVPSLAQITVTAGGDGWQNMTSYMSVSPQTFAGTLTGSNTVTSRPGHNTGGFIQTQVGIKDQLFFTYGLRVEWNPDFGSEMQPNYTPRYGLAYTQNIGALTAKIRGSYGRSTRPPYPGYKAERTASQSGMSAAVLTDYGNYNVFLANPDLGPEHQQGGEGGLELYLSSRGSFVITRYNQTVDGLINSPVVDSVRSLIPNPPSGGSQSDADGYKYRYQSQYLNIGSIRNQGWELQGSINIGSITTRGTYSWTKSRVVGITPKYRAFYTPSTYPQFQPGSSFNYLPEHTWAFGATYARGRTTVAFNASGTGRITISGDDFFYRHLHSLIRLSQDRLNVTTVAYPSFSRGYAIGDLMATHRVSTHIEGVLQIQNLANQYKNDYSANYAVIGRQTKVGLRWH